MVGEGTALVQDLWITPNVLCSDGYSQVLQQTLSYLSPVELCSAALVCSHWRDVSEAKQLWSDICNKDGIELMDWIDLSDNSLLIQIKHRCAPKAHYIGGQLVRKRWITDQGVTTMIRRLTAPCQKLVFMAFSNRHIFARNGQENDTNIYIFCGVSGEFLKRLVGHTSVVTRVLVCQSDSMFVAKDSHFIKIWNVDSGQCIQAIQHGQQNPFCCIAIHDHVLATWHAIVEGGCLCFWNTQSGLKMFEIPPVESFIRSVALDAKYVSYTEYTHLSRNSTTLHLLDVHTGHRLFTWQTDAAKIRGITLDSGYSNSLVAIFERAISVWDTETGEHRVVQQQLPGVRWICGVAVHGIKLIVHATDFYDKTMLTVLNIASGHILGTIPGGVCKFCPYIPCHFSILSTGLAVTPGEQGFARSDLGPELWDIHNLKFVRTLNKFDGQCKEYWIRTSSRMLQSVECDGKGTLTYIKQIFDPYL